MSSHVIAVARRKLLKKASAVASRHDPAHVLRPQHLTQHHAVRSGRLLAHLIDWALGKRACEEGGSAAQVKPRKMTGSNDGMKNMNSQHNRLLAMYVCAGFRQHLAEHEWRDACETGLERDPLWWRSAPPVERMPDFNKVILPALTWVDDRFRVWYRGNSRIWPLTKHWGAARDFLFERLPALDEDESGFIAGGERPAAFSPETSQAQDFATCITYCSQSKPSLTRAKKKGHDAARKRVLLPGLPYAIGVAMHDGSEAEQIGLERVTDTHTNWKPEEWLPVMWEWFNADAERKVEIVERLTQPRTCQPLWRLPMGTYDPSTGVSARKYAKAELVDVYGVPLPPNQRMKLRQAEREASIARTPPPVAVNHAPPVEERVHRKFLGFLEHLKWGKQKRPRSRVGETEMRARRPVGRAQRRAASFDF